MSSTISFTLLCTLPMALADLSRTLDYSGFIPSKLDGTRLTDSSLCRKFDGLSGEAESYCLTIVVWNLYGAAFRNFIWLGIYSPLAVVFITFANTIGLFGLVNALSPLLPIRGEPLLI